MAETAQKASIRVNGESEPLAAATLAVLLEEKAVDVSQRGIAVALNGTVVPRAAWPQNSNCGRNALHVACSPCALARHR